jgi:hypothetical protein
MTYRQLVDYFQNAQPKIGRGPVRVKIRELTGHQIQVAKTALDIRVCRGMYLSPQNQTARIVQQLGSHVVVMPREGNNNCWERFVEVKEYMHVFDSPQEATDTGELFDALLAEFCASGGAAQTMSHQVNAEHKAFWRALGVLCPEPYRLRLIDERAERGPDLTDYQIALRLRIPEQYIPCLFLEWYVDNQATLF